ncbi:MULTISPECIES: hypothetical protein [Bacillus]|uniref:hypothetical protein n=1 Tax=Bacillus TaxID=1386 RepID=UPI00077AC79F|nr:MULTISPECIES: hypothetical protein [Bacillus]KXY63892.1 hypothetical protein AT278_00055 [Bacillus cereus]MBP3971838.1 hypothetical protein [Bacillus sp. WL1]PED31773.1 hypothetical protein CON13_13090 [Bacillus cereus]PEE50247.1 hypothetical protein COM80_26420 [Bacillus cereus]PFL88561.1 hypothetical protein COJ35_28080 [Bacillus cereus]
MRREKDLLKQWKADLQAVQEEKRLKKKAKKKKKNKKYNIPGKTADFMDGKNIYRKENGVWKQRNK